MTYLSVLSEAKAVLCKRCFFDMIQGGMQDITDVLNKPL